MAVQSRETGRRGRGEIRSKKLARRWVEKEGAFRKGTGSI